MFKPYDEDKWYKCTHCGGKNYRETPPSFNTMQCALCNKIFYLGDKLLLSNSSKGKPAWWNIDEHTPFRDRISVLLERFPPQNAYIYTDFAVFDFWTLANAKEIINSSQISVNQFKGLSLNQEHCNVVIIDTNHKL